MCKYLIKDAFEVTASLSVLLYARRHIAEYPSVAEDSGSSERTAKHFMQRVLNKEMTELAPTQAAAIALGMSSSGHSHNYQYV